MSKEEAFPARGQDRAAILGALRALSADDLPKDGSAFAMSYDIAEDVVETAREAFAACMGGNGLDPTVYPSARRLENDVVSAVLSFLGAPEGAVGTATAGGTESVMLAVKAARDYARKTRPEITAPKMLLPETAHACFQKAAHYLGVEAVLVEVDPITMRASVEDMRKKITGDTILLVASAPSYAHGVVDPIEEIAALAKERGLLMHVDACIGGWMLSAMRAGGIAVPKFGFEVEGVTSLSVDLHKYGFAPKGISVLLQRRRELRDAQYYACGTWTGYCIVNSTTLGSKSLAALGAAWAVLRRVGRQGFIDLAKEMWEATGELIEGVEAVPGLSVLGKPDMGLLAVVSEGDLFELADRLRARGWYVQPTYAFGRSPAHIHLGLSPGNAPRVGELIDDLHECVEDLPAPIAPPAAFVQLLEGLATGEGGGVDVGGIMREMGIVDGKLPGSSAMIHRLLNAASPRAREGLLKLFIGELFT